MASKKRQKYSDEDLLKITRANDLYDSQWSLIGLIEFPGIVPNSLSTAFGRIPKAWTPKKGTKKLPLRIITEPEVVAVEIFQTLKKSKYSKSQMPVSLQRFLSGQDKKVDPVAKEQTEEELIEWLRFKSAELERANKDLRLKVGAQKELGVAIAGAVKASDPFPRYKYEKLKKKNKPPVIPVLILSDWHIGEVINKDEVEGFNEYNYQIAQDRIFGIVKSFLKWCEVQRRVYRMEESTIFTLGDFVSGNIHAELTTTNEFPLPVQTAKAGLLLGEVFCRIASHFDKLKIYEVGADNHSRLQKKPQAKQKALNSMGFLVHTIANQFCEKQENVKIIEATGIKIVAEVAGSKFLLEHGDTCKAWMGIPYYGVQREKGREAIKRLGTDKNFDFTAMGHFHVPSFLEGTTLINGSLSGTSEFDHSVGRFAPPSQMAFLVHPTHKIFGITPFRAE